MLITWQTVRAWGPCHDYTDARLQELYGDGKTPAEIATGNVSEEDRIWTLIRVLISRCSPDLYTDYVGWCQLRLYYFWLDYCAARDARAARATRAALDARATRAARAALDALDALDARDALDDALTARATRAALDALDARDARAARDALDALDARAARAAECQLQLDYLVELIGQ